MRALCPTALAVALTFAAPASAQEVNSSQLSENGWFSDDTRADGEGIFAAGTNLVSPTLTDDPEATASGNAVFDAEILELIQFGAAPGTPPLGTFKGAVRLRDRGTSASGKAQISHRDTVTGHATGDAFGPGFTAEYHWVGLGGSQFSASLKFGFQTADFGSTGSSSRTGENVWDKVLIYEPGQGNGQVSDGTWKTETIDWSNGKWWFFDRTVGASIQGTPRTLEEMSTDLTVFDGGSKTIQDVYNLIVDPTTVLTSVQFGVGSNNPGADVYVNQLECSAYRSGQTTTFGTPSPFDQNVTPDTIFGSGNTNGGFTVDRFDGIELGLRVKRRFPAPMDVFNSNGDGSYTWPAGDGNPPNGDPVWQWDWTVNTDVDDSTGRVVGDLTYELGIDFDPTSDTNYLAFDPVTPGPLNPAPDHAFGDNSSSGDDGVGFGGDPSGYASALTTFNVLQQSWRHTFFDDPVNFPFDPTVDGQYEVYLAAFENGQQVARTQITVFAVNGASLTVEADPCQTDQDAVLPGTQVAYQLWLRNPDDIDVTGFKAFLSYDSSVMTYEGAASSYNNTDFTSNIDPIDNATSPLGSLSLDGNTFTGAGSGSAVSGDSLLATLIFTVTDCDLNDVTFDLSQAFPSELSFEGTPIATNLVDSVEVLGDGEAPVIAATANITQASDAGECGQAIVTFATPSVTDNCDPAPSIACDPPSGSVFPQGATTVTCTATDACGNVSTSTFTVTVTDTVLINVDVVLVGSEAATRCIQFVPDECAGATSVPLTFVKSGFDAVATATIEVPCGLWSQLCAKDEQHTLWDTVALTDDGAIYSVAVPLVLRGGDTDNDGDVDINDVTLFLAQFGDLDSDGGCAYDGTTRDADFDNTGAVGASDYSSLVANWLEITSCACTAPSTSGVGTRGNPRQRRVSDGVSQAADLNRDGFVDWRDVRVLEERQRLSGDLSRAMRGE